MELNDVQVKPHDLRHPLGVIEFVEFLQKYARGLLERDNGITEMIAFIAITRYLRTGVPLPDVSLAVVTTTQLGLGDSGRDKQIFSELVKRIARQGEALMTCFLSEAWTLDARTEEDVLLAKQWVQTHDGIEDCPLRQDSMMIQVEHKALSPRHQIWVAPINTVDGKRSVGEFTNTPNPDGGRFCNLLPD